MMLLQLFSLPGVFRKLLPFIIGLLIIGLIASGVLYVSKSFDNLKLENEALKLNIAKLEKDIDILVKTNSDNAKELTTVIESCDVTVSETKALMAKQEKHFKNQINILKNKNAKEAAVDTFTATNTDGTVRPLTELEKDQYYSDIRMDSLYEAYSDPIVLKDTKTCSGC